MSDDPIMDATNYEKEMDDSFEKTVKDTLGLPEAPASATIRVYIDDYSTLITVRGTEANDVVRKAEYIVDYAKRQGWRSTWNKEQPNYPQPNASVPIPPNYAQAPPPTVAQPQTYAPPPAPAPAQTGAPMCPTHGRPMKMFNGKYGNFWKCTAKIGDGWCNEKVNIK